MSVHHLVDLALPHIGEGVARRWWGEAWGNMGALVGDGADTGKWEGIREFRPPPSKSLVSSIHPPARGVGRGTLNQL